MHAWLLFSAVALRATRPARGKPWSCGAANYISYLGLRRSFLTFLHLPRKLRLLFLLYLSVPLFKMAGTVLGKRTRSVVESAGKNIPPSALIFQSSPALSSITGTDCKQAPNTRPPCPSRRTSDRSSPFITANEINCKESDRPTGPRKWRR